MASPTDQLAPVDAAAESEPVTLAALNDRELLLHVAGQLDELHTFVTTELRPLLETFATAGAALSKGGLAGVMGLFTKKD